ncbi:MAG: hypothetical protein AAGF46_08255, partial [Pseudomonadota bacterium]
IAPVSLWYEDITAGDPGAVVTQIGEALSIPGELLAESARDLPQTSLEKLPIENTRELISQFRGEHPDFVAYWQRWRGVHHLGRFRREQPQLAAIAASPKRRTVNH